MSYMHIDNLYRAPEILNFRECYAMEKIHGTSSHISYNKEKVGFFSGGCNYEDFVNLFDKEKLENKFKEVIWQEETCIVYGEAYGGKLQGMRDTYGNNLRFVAFEVKIGDKFLDVPSAEHIVKYLGLEFVYYNKVSTDLKILDFERDSLSVQALRNGCGYGKPREGIVLRPLFEVTMNNGKRVIAKHKSEKFRETSTPRKVSEEKLKIISEAREIANEWVTYERLNHILTKGIIDPVLENTGKIIKAMIEDIERESEGEIVKSQEERKEIGRKTAIMFKQCLKDKILH